MGKMTKNEIEIRSKFIETICDYCDIQSEYYTNISSNDDHSEDFVNRMTDMATSFNDVCKFISIVADRTKACMLDDIPARDTTSVGEQVEQQALSQPIENKQPDSTTAP